MPRFTETVYRSLKAAGWYEGRHVDVSKAVRELQKKGFLGSPAAMCILEEFYGLSAHRVSFIQDRMLGIFFPEANELEFIAPLVGEPMCPMAYGGGGYAFAAPSGRIVHLDDMWTFISFENSLGDYLERIYAERIRFSKVVHLTDEQRPPDMQSTAPE